MQGGPELQQSLGACLFAVLSISIIQERKEADGTLPLKTIILV